jgi:hypothetical protein
MVRNCKDSSWLCPDFPAWTTSINVCSAIFEQRKLVHVLTLHSYKDKRKRARRFIALGFSYGTLLSSQRQ